MRFRSRFRVPGMVVFAFMVASFGAPVVRAQSGTTGGLEGRVTSEDGAALPGVTVTVESTDGAFSRTTITNANGEFRARHLPAGEFRVTTSLEGFDPSQRQVTVGRGKMSDIDVTLLLSTMDEELIVTAESPVLATGVEDDVPQLLLELPAGVDRAVFDLPPRIGSAGELAWAPGGWSYDPSSATLEGTAGPGPGRFRLAFDGASKLPRKISLSTWVGDEVAYDGKIEPTGAGPAPQIDLKASALPGVVAPGDPIWIFVPDADPDSQLFVLPPGGALPTPSPFPLPVRDGWVGGAVPLDAEPGDALDVQLRDRWGRLSWRGDWSPGLGDSYPPAGVSITGTSDLAWADQTFCVCGDWGDGPFGAPGLDSVSLGGSPAGPPVAISPGAATFRVPKGTPSGAAEIDAGGGASQPAPEARTVEVIRAFGSVDMSAIERGHSTKLRLRIEGTERPLPVELENRSPTFIRMSPADRLSLVTTGGAENAIPPVDVTGLRAGGFDVDYVVRTGECPCAPPTPAASEVMDGMISEAVDLFWSSIGSGPGDSTANGLPSGGPRLFSGRYQVVDLDWVGAAGPVQMTELDGGAGLLFSDPGNWEVLIQVLDGCAVNEHYWVFFAATTNVEFTLRVTDSETAGSRTYTNPLDAPFEPVVDTMAFATCP